MRTVVQCDGLYPHVHAMTNTSDTEVAKMSALEAAGNAMQCKTTPSQIKTKTIEQVLASISDISSKRCVQVDAKGVHQPSKRRKREQPRRKPSVKHVGVLFENNAVDANV